MRERRFWGDHSRQSTTHTRAWSVLCDTSDGNYLLLVNAKTRQVYAVNYVEETKFDTDYYRSDQKESDEDTALREDGSLLSRDAARGQALHYLSFVGVSARNLKAAPAPSVSPAVHKPVFKSTYHFAFTGLPASVTTDHGRGEQPKWPLTESLVPCEGHLRSCFESARRRRRKQVERALRRVMNFHVTPNAV